MSSTYPPGQSNAATTESRTTNGHDIIHGETRRMWRQTTRNLRDDLNNLKTDLDVLVSRATSLSETELKDAYGQMMSKFSTLRYAAKGIATQAGQQFNQGVDVTTEYVKERPLQAVGVAAAIGLALGMLLGRH